MAPVPQDEKERFIDKLTVDPDGCWTWTASKSRSGYGSFQLRGRKERAHRVSYALFVGDIPAGADLHHTCGNRSCVNFGHLEVLSRAAHRQSHLPEQCKHGHEFNEENTFYRPTGGRACRECGRATCRRYYSRRKSRGGI